jgi:hypothetical protein
MQYHVLVHVISGTNSSLVIARSVNDEAISKRDSSLSLGTKIATPPARNDEWGIPQCDEDTRCHPSI